MKFKRDRQNQIISFVYYSLLTCFILLSLFITGVSIFRFFFDKGLAVTKQEKNLWKSYEGQTFTGLGMIRVSTTDPQPGLVIISVSFIYYPDDRAFFEELVYRVRDFREIIIGFIGSFTVSELQRQGEDYLKDELLRRFNSILRLGQIKALYFSDFMII